MSYPQNYYGKNIVADPAFVFKRASWERVSKRVGLPIGAAYLWALITSIASALVGVIGVLLMAGLISSLTNILLGRMALNPSAATLFDLVASLSLPTLLIMLLVFALASAASIFVGAVSQYGLANLALRYKRDREAGLGDAFGAFANFGRAFMVSALTYLLGLAWGLVPIIGLPLSVIAGYRYRFAYFVLIDDPGISAIDAIRESKRLMYGNKGQVFVQDASLLGWAAGFGLTSNLLGRLLGFIPVVGPIIALALIPIFSTAYFGLLGMYRETAAAGFYDQARSGSSTRDDGPLRRQADVRPSITALSGLYNGAIFRFEPGEEVVIGRDSALCNIILDDGSDNISRKHLSVLYDPRDQVYIVTDFSRNGTFTDDGRQMVANAENKLPRGSVLVVGSRANTIRLD
jgi:uncharacterized membrane protein